MKTRLTDMLEVEHPVMLAGMGGVSYHEVVAAVSEAGGFGTLGASTMGDALVDEMRGVKQLTSKPFGVDLLTAVPGQTERQIETVIAARLAPGVRSPLLTASSRRGFAAAPIASPWFRLRVGSMTTEPGGDGERQSRRARFPGRTVLPQYRQHELQKRICGPTRMLLPV